MIHRLRPLVALLLLTFTLTVAPPPRFVPPPVHATITATANHCKKIATAGVTTNGCGMPGTTTTGNSILACVYWNTATEGHLTGVAGDGGITFVLRPTTYVTQGGLSLKIADAISASGVITPNITASFSTSMSDTVIEVQELTNIASFDLAKTNTQTNVGTGTDAVTTGASGTRAQANEVVWGCSGSSNNSVTIAAGTGYTASEIAGTGYITSEYQVFSAVGTQAATWTLGSGTTNNMFSSMAAYKDVVAGGGGGASTGQRNRQPVTF